MGSSLLPRASGGGPSQSEGEGAPPNNHPPPPPQSQRGVAGETSPAQAVTTLPSCPPDHHRLTRGDRPARVVHTDQNFGQIWVIIMYDCPKAIKEGITMSLLGSLLSTNLELPKRRSIFVSYHHDNDQHYKHQLTSMLSESYQTIDRSLPEKIRSENPDYIMRHIRENFIKGTSATIVICGRESHLRKYIDWEIKATLDKCHGLIGVYLESALIPSTTLAHCPRRLSENIDSGYANWYNWNSFCHNADTARSYIEYAIASDKAKIVNNLPLKSQNGTQH